MVFLLRGTKIKTKSNDTIAVTMVVVGFILRSMKHGKECETKSVTGDASLRKIRRKQVPFRTSFFEIA